MSTFTLKTYAIKKAIDIVTNSLGKPQQTPSVENHANPPRVVYCAIHPTLTRFTNFRVSNLHITSTQYAANTLHQRIFSKGGYPVTIP